MSPGGSGNFTCTQNTELVTNKFESGGLESCSTLKIDTEFSKHTATAALLAIAEAHGTQTG